MAYQGAPDLETLSSFIFHYGDPKYKKMLATGITDKNGEMLYQDDIVEYNNRKSRIYFTRGGFAIKYPAWSNDLSDLDEVDQLILEPLSDPQNISFIQSQATKIGNIYENTELL
jgi:hypothetical protein